MQALRHVFQGTPLCSALRSGVNAEAAVLNRLFASNDSSSPTGGYGSPTWGAVRLCALPPASPRSLVLQKVMAAMPRINLMIECNPFVSPTSS